MARRRVIDKGVATVAPNKPRKTNPKTDPPRPSATLGRVTMRRLAIGKIKAAAYNPRRDLGPADAAYQAIARSIDDFGLVDPLVWNERSGNLVGGHQRLKVLRDRGATHVDVSVVDLSPAREKALNLALNKTSGTWDDDALAKLLGELRSDPAGGIESTGFEADEIDALLARVEEQIELKPLHAEVTHSFKVMVTCKGKKQQAQVLALLKGRGIACHALTRE